MRMFTMLHSSSIAVWQCSSYLQYWFWCNVVSSEQYHGMQCSYACLDRGQYRERKGREIKVYLEPFVLFAS